jgi:secreted PhoX family phosphatase
VNPLIVSRRGFLFRTAAGFVGLGFGGISATALMPSVAAAAGADDLGDLLAPDANGLRLPPGFQSRIVARSGQTVGTTSYVWHENPDGGAIFPMVDGGWLYVSNAESLTTGTGGVGVLRFDANAQIVDAYRILSGTTHNCAGGKTPWNTWLSCEEIPTGRVFECDPFAPGSQGVARPALGIFQHEAAAVDPVRQKIYLTEDRPDSLLYRFTPSVYPNLASGTLEAARILDPNSQGPIIPGQVRPVTWQAIPDPLATQTETRFQLTNVARFNGGEGIDYHEGFVYFSTKGDNRIWKLDTAADQIEIRFDRATTPSSPLSGVDNVFVTPQGDIYVAEDPGDLQIVALTTTGQAKPIVQVTGQDGSEVTGPALSPDGRRLYFSSQRLPGTTYEIEGPFLGRSVPALGMIPTAALAGALGWAAIGGLRGSAAARPPDADGSEPR